MTDICAVVTLLERLERLRGRVFIGSAGSAGTLGQEGVTTLALALSGFYMPSALVQLAQPSPTLTLHRESGLQSRGRGKRQRPRVRENCRPPRQLHGGARKYTVRKAAAPVKDGGHRSDSGS